MSFLPDEYRAPKKPSGYMKFVDGENAFRILSNTIVGWEYWVGDKNNRKPVRVRVFEDMPEDEQIKYEDGDNQDKPRFFWAFLVWNYMENRAQILEITQSSIQKKIENLCKSVRWGDPVGKYDIIVTKSKTGDKVTYDTEPAPPTLLDLSGKNVPEVNLHALYEGGDPFSSKGNVDTESVGYKKEVEAPINEDASPQNVFDGILPPDGEVIQPKYINTPQEAARAVADKSKAWSPSASQIAAIEEIVAKKIELADMASEAMKSAKATFNFIGKYGYKK